MDLKDIKAIIDLMKKNSITEFELETSGFKDQAEARPEWRCPGCFNPMIASDGAMPQLPPIRRLPLRRPLPVAPPPAATGEVEIKSPMIGTFYRAPSPEAASYVEVGTEVNPDTVVCIIEAMKVMNEIKAEVKGVITQVLVENAKPVEFGQPLFKVRPA